LTSPILVTADGHDELVTAFSSRFAGYDLMSGSNSGSVRVLAALSHARPFYAEQAAQVAVEVAKASQAEIT
jgi:hypothetical protein